MFICSHSSWEIRLTATDRYLFYLILIFQFSSRLSFDRGGSCECILLNFEVSGFEFRCWNSFQWDWKLLWLVTKCRKEIKNKKVVWFMDYYLWSALINYRKMTFRGTIIIFRLVTLLLEFLLRIAVRLSRTASKEKKIEARKQLPGNGGK